MPTRATTFDGVPSPPHRPRVGRYEFTIEIAAPIEGVFALWTDLDRAGEWIGGLTSVTDRSGRPDRAGTTYVSHFGPMHSPTEILEADPPRWLRTKFGSWLLRGETTARFEPLPDGRTRLTQTFRTIGIIPAISSRVFAMGSYEGSFKGELQKFARIAEDEAARPSSTGSSRAERLDPPTSSG
jgi:uncharacterized protein YndB with AHSA1/START domain